MNRMLLLLVLMWTLAPVAGQAGDWKGIEEVLGRQGVVQEDMLKITFPRTELTVKIGQVQIEPSLALTSWIGFKGTEKHAMVMGDLVLLVKEIAQVTARLKEGGIEITALHNHLVGTMPSVMYLHFGGYGDPRKLGQALRAALSLTSTPIGPPPLMSESPKADWSKVEAILGKNGTVKGNVLQVSFLRREKIMENGMEVPPFLGMATSINLQVAINKAATTGDFVLLADEVNPVVKALIDHGIIVTAIHGHMLHETPRLFFLHFWGVDAPEKLAKGLKAALALTNAQQ